MCATGTAVLVLAVLTAVTIAIFPQKVPLQTPPPPANGGCETCDPVNLTIPPNLRHEYWVGLSIAQAAGTSGGPDWMLVIAPMLALFAGGFGTGLAEASRRTGNRGESPASAAPPAPARTQVRRRANVAGSRRRLGGVCGGHQFWGSSTRRSGVTVAPAASRTTMSVACQTTSDIPVQYIYTR